MAGNNLLLAQYMPPEQPNQLLAGMDSPDLSGPAAIYAFNKQFLKPGAKSFNTQLSPGAEKQFRSWLQQNGVPFNPDAAVTDYDMRGFYQALQNGDPKAASAIDPNDSQLHYPDYWKTPFHPTFSNESQFATPDAPHWTPDDKLVTSDGQVIFDDRAR